MFAIDSVGMIYSGVYAVSCADVRSDIFRVSGVGTSQAYIRRQVNGHSMRHITCPKQQMKQKFISSCCNLYTQIIYSSRMAECDSRASSSCCGTWAWA